MSKRIILFDCDETLWNSLDRDYISSCKSVLIKAKKHTIVRLADGKRFTLKRETIQLFQSLAVKGFTIGIVSDNKPAMVRAALKLSGLLKYINKKAINIKLWDGYCPKHLMIQEILDKPEFHSIDLKLVYWVDDKDYAAEAKKIGVNFIKVGKGSLISLVKSLII